MAEEKGQLKVKGVEASTEEVSTVFPLVPNTKANLVEVGRLVEIFDRLEGLGPAAACCKHTWER